VTELPFRFSLEPPLELTTSPTTAGLEATAD